jgi:hypothetical protein
MDQPNPFPTFAEAMMVELDELAWMVDSADSLSFGTLHILEQASLHQHFIEGQKNPCFIALLARSLMPMCAPQNPLWISFRSSTPFLEVMHLSHGSVTPDL